MTERHDEAIEADVLIEAGHPSRPDREELMRRHIARIKARAWDEGYNAAREVVDFEGIKVWAHTVMPEGYEGNPYRDGVA